MWGANAPASRLRWQAQRAARQLIVRAERCGGRRSQAARGRGSRPRSEPGLHPPGRSLRTLAVVTALGRVVRMASAMLNVSLTPGGRGVLE